MRLALAFALLFATKVVVAFEPEHCDVYVFRTQEDALWHCGARLPDDSQYCDHKVDDDPPKWAWTWPSDYPDDLCEFMIATVVNDDSPPTTPDDTFASTLVDWGCYMVDEEAGIITAAYLVNSTAGEHASDVTEPCERTIDYFDYWNLRDEDWWGGGDVPPLCKSFRRI